MRRVMRLLARRRPAPTRCRRCGGEDLAALSDEVAKTRPPAERVAAWQNDIRDLEAAAAAPDFWDDSDKAQSLARLAALKGDRDAVAAGDALLEDAAAALDGFAESENDEESEAFYAEAATDALDALRKALEERQLAQALNGPFDACACRLEVQAGAGGLDAQDWTAMVARMYARFCDARGLQCRELERAEGDHPGCVKSGRACGGPARVRIITGRARRS